LRRASASGAHEQRRGIAVRRALVGGSFLCRDPDAEGVVAADVEPGRRAPLRSTPDSV